MASVTEGCSISGVNWRNTLMPRRNGRDNCYRWPPIWRQPPPSRITVPACIGCGAGTCCQPKSKDKSSRNCAVPFNSKLGTPRRSYPGCRSAQAIGSWWQALARGTLEERRWRIEVSAA